MFDVVEYRSLYEGYKFPGFTCSRVVKGVFGGRQALVVRPNRRSKKQFAGPAVRFIKDGTINATDVSEISLLRRPSNVSGSQDTPSGVPQVERCET